MSILFAGMTDIGRKRKTNQDAIHMNPALNFFLVADGMGGHNGGDIASSLAVKVVPEFLETNQARLNEPSILYEAYQHTNQEIYKKSIEHAHLRGMGTTMVSLLFNKDGLRIANVGDSRAYLFSKGHLYQLTRDHSLVQEKMNLGIYNRADAKQDMMKNVLVRTIGFEEQVEVDLFHYRVSKNDVLFICSDGLFGKVSDRDLHFLIQKKLPDPSKATQEAVNALVREMIEQANNNGGQDNISLILTVCL